MRTDKEYPATHSMSTAWYIVDDEGNVGIMDYNENGPVPWGVEQTSSDDLKFGHWEDSYCKIIKFNLTNEQILDLLSNPHKPSEEKMWYECVVRIAKEKKERFIELCKNEDIDAGRIFCLSEGLGLYEFDAYECAHDINYLEKPVSGSLKLMLDENIIIEVYSLQELDMNDKFKNDEVIFEKEFENSPYYMFHQPYWTGCLPKKMHQPKHPVKMDQIPERFRHRLHKIPGSFKDMDTFQIAQYYPCEEYCNNTYIVDGCSYQLSPLPDGTEVYTKSGMCHYPFFNYCSEKEKFHCTQKCTTQCCDIFDMYINDKPTVLIIFDPREEADYNWKIETNIVFQNSYATPYISKLPYRIADKGLLFQDDVIKYINQECLSKILKESKGYIEAIINDIRPRVILVTDMAFEVMNDVFKLTNKKIEINSEEYPFYSLSELFKHSAIIDELAQMPFRGKHHPQLISTEEMDFLIKNGIAKEYSTLI